MLSVYLRTILGDTLIRLSSITTLYRLFAVDTGAFYGNRYDNYLPTGITVADFEMPALHSSLRKFVGAFFGSNSNYYDGDVSSTLRISALDRVSEVLVGLARAYASDSFDERCCSCEIQTDIDIPLLPGTLETIVIPTPLADNQEVMNACAQWGVQPILYRFKRATPESRTEIICEKLADFYERREYL